MRRRRHTDRRDERRCERVVRKPEQDARLAHTRVADQQQFEQQIVRLLGHRGRGVFVVAEPRVSLESAPGPQSSSNGGGIRARAITVLYFIFTRSRDQIIIGQNGRVGATS